MSDKWYYIEKKVGEKGNESMSQYIYGRNVIVSRIKEAKDIDEIYIQDTIKDRNILDLVTKNNIKTFYCKKSKLDKLAGNEFHQGVVAKVHTYDYYDFEKLIDDLQTKDDALLVMLDGIEDPHNLGAILRSCEAIGVDGVVVPKHGSCSLNSTVAKTSTGAIELVKVSEVVNLNSAINRLKDAGYWIVGAEANNSLDYREIDYNSKIVLVVGSEGKGISRLVSENCDYKVRLPMRGKVNSLNVSVACAVLLYQIYNNRFPL